jgi:hypothetical protein
MKSNPRARTDEHRPYRAGLDDSTFDDSVQNVKWKNCVRLDSDAVEVAIDDWQKLRRSAGKGLVYVLSIGTNRTRWQNGQATTGSTKSSCSKYTAKLIK